MFLRARSTSRWIVSTMSLSGLPGGARESSMCEWKGRGVKRMIGMVASMDALYIQYSTSTAPDLPAETLMCALHHALAPLAPLVRATDSYPPLSAQRSSARLDDDVVWWWQHDTARG